MASKRDARAGGWHWRFNSGVTGANGAGEAKNNNNPNRKAIEAVATSIYITNFPQDWNETVIWKQCQEFGRVVDVYLSPRLSKAGKKFAFVRFLRVSNISRLVSDMSSKWYGSYHMYACVAQFLGRMLLLSPKFCMHLNPLCMMVHVTWIGLV